MKKIILVLLLLAQMLNAKVLSATYEVSYGIFQAMGIADARFEIKDDQTYAIQIEARTTGIAKLLSNNRVETYESYGTVKNGRLIPQKFVQIRQTNSKKSITTYTFDHLNKVVFKDKVKNENRDKTKNDFYASEDILTLFFNIGMYAKGHENQVMYAIGGNGKDGRIDVEFPKGNDLKAMQNELKMEDGDFLKVILNDRIFSSANGELLINLGSDGLCDKAVLEDVLLFGDIVGKRVR
jgi:hypothetical protein